MMPRAIILQTVHLPGPTLKRGSMTDVPVVIVFFDRPQMLAKLWERIELARPSTLIGLSDGPKVKADLERINQCREIFKPTWKCEFVPVYLEENVGVDDNVRQGLTKVFSWFEEAIVLEDDCIPDPSFFRYCSELLERYKFDERIFSISGLNQFAGRYDWTEQSDYAFSRFFSSWGWAGWRRNWQSCRWHQQDENWPVIESLLASRGLSNDSIAWWRKVVRDHWRDLWNAWDFQFCLTGLTLNKLTVFPRQNAVTNIGMNSGVHFNNYLLPWKLPPVQEFVFPLADPELVVIDNQYDNLFEKRHYDTNRARRVIRRLMERTAFSPTW